MNIYYSRMMKMDNYDKSLTFEELFSKHKEKFIRFAQSYVKDKSIAEDFVIDAFVDYWQRRHAFEEEINIPAYILTVIKHKCINYLKHQQLKFEVLDKMQSHQQWKNNMKIATLEICDPNELFSSEIQELIYKALKEMPVRTAQIFYMSRFQNKSHQEIANYLGVTTKSIEFHITKVLRLLRVTLCDYL